MSNFPALLNPLASLLVFVLLCPPQPVDGAEFPAPSAHPLAGQWQGTWESSGNGHKGRLKARIWHLRGNEYQAVFTGTFFKFIPFIYRAKLCTVQEGNCLRLYSSKSLGPLLGKFTMQGTASECVFVAHFASGEDRGIFRMQRRQ